MRVQKRNGNLENVSFDKVINRIKTLCEKEPVCKNIDPTLIAQKVCARIYDGVKTTELDELAAQITVAMCTTHIEYATLAGRIIISNNHKNTKNTFTETMALLFNEQDGTSGKMKGLISKSVYNVILENKEQLDQVIDHERDFTFDFFSFKTLEKAYLMKVNGAVAERIQYMFLRVALGIHGTDVDAAINTYHLMSTKAMIHATPTLFHSGCEYPQLLSCFLLGTDDSVDGIYKTISDCAMISKWAGGIGIHISNIRSNNSVIRGTHGKTSGIVPMLKVYNETARYVNQCFTPDTIVYTPEGHKRIDEINIKDRVVTKDGSFKRVLGIAKNEIQEKLISIRSTHSIEGVKCTKVHEVFALKNQKRMTNFTTIKGRLDAGTIHPTFVPAGEISREDFLVYPIPTFSKDIEKYTNDVCRFYGILLGDGHYSKKSSCKSIECGITLGHLKDETYNFVIDFLEENNIHYWENAQHGCVQVKWTLNELFPIRYDDVYDENHEKHVSPSFLNLPREKQLLIVKGLLETDGSVQKEIYFTSTSRNLIESVRYMLLCNSILTSGHYNKNRIGQVLPYKNIKAVKQPYVLRIPKHNVICDALHIQPATYLKFFEHKGLLYSRVKLVTETEDEYTGTVFDLNIEDNHNYLTHMGLVHNSGKRNGSFAVYLSPWHDDIFEFMDLRKNHGDENARARDLFYAMWMSDLFMRKVKLDEDWYTFNPDDCKDLNNTFGAEFEEAYDRYVQEEKYVRKVKARAVWMEILKSQMETGTPYLLYKDACNEKSNQKNIGVIKSSNLCVSPSTMVLTDNGYFPIKDLEKQDINVWNGKEFSKVVVHKTGTDQSLITLHFSNGQTLTCTKYHKFFIQKGYLSSLERNRDILQSSKVDVVEAQHLKAGMRLVKCDFPVLDTKRRLKDAYTNGFFTGDGTYGNISKTQKESKCQYKSLDGTSYCKRHYGMSEPAKGPNKMCQGICYQKHPQVCLYGEKMALLDELAYRTHGQEKNNRLTVMLPWDLEEKYFVPINYSLESKLDWFAGLSDADGCITRNGSNQSLQVSSIHREFLQNIVLMLQTCGISSKVSSIRRTDKPRPLPNGKGGYAIYDTKPMWRLLVASRSLQKLCSLGFHPKRLVIEDHTPNRSSEHFVKVTRMEDNGEIDDTYCFTETKRNAGIFNGIFTSQCAEIVEYSDKDEYACCTLASLGLPSFVKKRPFNHTITMYSKPNCSYCDVAKLMMEENGTNYIKKVLDTDFSVDDLRAQINEASNNSLGNQRLGFPQFFVENQYVGDFNGLLSLIRPAYDFEALHNTVKTLTKNLNKIIDLNYYPVKETEVSNKKHRPIGIGVQGLADVYSKMRMPFDSPEAHALNKEIFATIYYAAVETSYELAREEGSYSTFENSPMSKGQFQFNLWNAEGLKEVGHKPVYPGDLSTHRNLDWETLRTNIRTHGQRNSLLVALMPTASTSQILGNNECIEPYTSTIYVRRTLAGDFVVINKYLISDLCALGLWNEELKNRIVMENGSIQNIESIPLFLRKLYKVVWDLSQKTLIDQAADRGLYVCQSQSLNLFVEKPTAQNLSSMHFYAWSKGLKTGMYYLRTRAAAKAQQFTVDPRLYQKYAKKEEICESCSG